MDSLSKNDYHIDVIKSVVEWKLNDFSQIKTNTVAKCTIYTCLPWLGPVSDNFTQQISPTVENAILLPTYVLCSLQNR